jgi:hypothetical protein
MSAISMRFSSGLTALNLAVWFDITLRVVAHA